MTAHPQLPKLSSRFTFVAKYVFPWFWFSFLSLYFILILLVVIFNEDTPKVMLIAPILLAAFGCGIFKFFITDLVDEVYDGGSYLLVRSKNSEDIIQLANVSEVTQFLFWNPPRVTLILKKESKFGSKISFIPPSRIIRFLPNPAIRDLINRVNKANQAL